MSQTKEQKNALFAYENVQAHVKSNYVDKYGTQAHKLPLLIRTAGLVAALEFLETRKGNEGAVRLISDVQKHARKLNLIGDKESLREAAIKRPLAEYLRLTREVSQIVTWYKRFSVSVLDVEQGSE